MTNTYLLDSFYKTICDEKIHFTMPRNSQVKLNIEKYIFVYIKNKIGKKIIIPFSIFNIDIFSMENAIKNKNIIVYELDSDNNRYIKRYDIYDELADIPYINYKVDFAHKYISLDEILNNVTIDDNELKMKVDAKINIINNEIKKIDNILDILDKLDTINDKHELVKVEDIMIYYKEYLELVLKVINVYNKIVLINIFDNICRDIITDIKKDKEFDQKQEGFYIRNLMFDDKDVSENEYTGDYYALVRHIEDDKQKWNLVFTRKKFNSMSPSIGGATQRSVCGLKKNISVDGLSMERIYRYKDVQSYLNLFVEDLLKTRDDIRKMRKDLELQYEKK